MNSLDRNHDMRDILGTAKSIEVMKEVCQTLKERVQFLNVLCFANNFRTSQCYCRNLTLFLVNRAVLKSVGKKDEMQVEETQYPLAKFYIMN